jgi:hypothetical protein
MIIKKLLPEYKVPAQALMSSSSSAATLIVPGVRYASRRDEVKEGMAVPDL